MSTELTGQCLCGAVRFRAVCRINRVSACYCGQCRTLNGGGPFYGAEMQGELHLERSDTLKWYASSQKAQRGFCQNCGASLIWRSVEDPSFFDISLGVLDDSSGLMLDAHIFADSCPSYVTIGGAAPQLSEAEMEAIADDGA